MNTTPKKAGKSTYYQLFRVSIWIKAISSVGEIIAGVLITFIPSSFVVKTSLLLTQGDVDGDKDDFLAHLILSAAHSFSLSNDLLIGIYIFARGLVQFIIVIALFQNKRWAYPALIVVLVLIICIQTYEIIISHSLAAAILTIIDVVTLLLVINEYRTVCAWRAQYGTSPCTALPQKLNASDAGSPIGHLHICEPSVSMVAEPVSLETCSALQRAFIECTIGGPETFFPEPCSAGGGGSDLDFFGTDASVGRSGLGALHTGGLNG